MISQNLIQFETIFNSLLSLQILEENRFNTDEKLEAFLEDVCLNLQNSYPKRATHYRRTIDKLKEDYGKYHDIYCFFDSLTLGQAVTLYTGLPEPQRRALLGEMSNYGIAFGATNPEDLRNLLFRIVNIRNCIDHGNSLEVLIHFYNRHDGSLRKPSDRKRYLSLIARLLNK